MGSLTNTGPTLFVKVNEDLQTKKYNIFENYVLTPLVP